MIFCLSLFVVLLSEITGFEKVCHENLNRPVILAASSVEYEKLGLLNCSFLVSAPDEDTLIILNFTRIHGFGNPDVTISPKEQAGMPADSNCLPRLRIMELKANSGLAAIGGSTICSHPQVFRYTSRQVRIFFQWRHKHASGFKLVLQFKRGLSLHVCGEEGDCSEDSSCVSSSTLTCGGSSFHLQRNWTTLVIIVVIAVIVVSLQMLAVLFCCQYRRVNQLWQERELQRNALNAERAQLNPPTTPVTGGVMYSAGQLDARAQREVDRQREHQIRVQSVNKDFRLNLPPFIPLTRDGEEGYTQSQRQLTSSQRYKGSISICPPPNMTICPPSDSGPPFHSQSDMVLNKHGTGLSGKAAHRTEPPMSAPPATTDNNNRKSNLNFNYSPVSVGGSSEQASRPPSHSQHASLSLGMYGAVHGHSGWSAEECPAGTTTSAGQPPPANANVNANGRRSPCSPGADTTTSSMIAPPPPYTQQNHSNNM